jgi:DNA uptake protein ComE-like DNA-binding protein
MKSDTSPIRNWFGYTRRERRASFILLVLIVSVISVRFLIPEKRIPIENIPLDLKENMTGSESVPSDKALLSGYHNLASGSASDDTLHPSESKWNEGGKLSRSQAKQKKKSFIVDINRCDTSEIIKLPGIGPVLSVRIIRYRQLLGGFASKDQLREVYGLPSETYDLVKDMVFVDTLLISKININVADYKMLDRMPYFERYEVTAILKYRELEGMIRDISELVDNKVITEEKALKVRPYLRFE